MSAAVLDPILGKRKNEFPESTEEGRIETLKELVALYLPQLVQQVEIIANTPSVTKMYLTSDLYSDELTPKHHFHAYTLLGMAVKYVQLHGLQVNIGE